MSTAEQRLKELEAENLRLRAQVGSVQDYAVYFGVCKVKDIVPLPFERWYWQKAGTEHKQEASR